MLHFQRASGESGWLILSVATMIFTAGLIEDWTVIGCLAGIIASWFIIEKVIIFYPLLRGFSAVARRDFSQTILMIITLVGIPIVEFIGIIRRVYH
ncbi:MAG: hypothetical protein ABIN61_03710 [candidate division WOR-3 bacterium]